MVDGFGVPERDGGVRLGRRRRSEPRRESLNRGIGGWGGGKC